MESEGGGVQLPKDVMGEAAGNGTEVGQTVSYRIILQKVILHCNWVTLQIQVC